MSANDINSPERLLFGPPAAFGLGNSLSRGGPQTIVLAFVRHLAKSVARPHPKPQNGSFLGPRLCWLGAQPSFCTKIGLFVVSDSPMRFRQPKNGLFSWSGCAPGEGPEGGEQCARDRKPGVLLGRARLCKPKNHGFRAGRGGLTIPYRPTVPTRRATRICCSGSDVQKKDRPCATMDWNGSEWIGMDFRLGFTPPRRLRSIPIHCREGRSQNTPKGPDSQINSGRLYLPGCLVDQNIVKITVRGCPVVRKSRKSAAFEVSVYLVGAKIVETNGRAVPGGP